MITSRIQTSAKISQQAPASVAVNKTNFSNVLNSVMSNKNMDQIFKEASEKYGVPVNLLKAVAKVESNFNPDAKSRCGAMGVMQLMPKTAAGLGVGNPYNAEENINGGAKLLSGLFKKYNGDLTLTLAAYNAGSGNVAKYGGVPPFTETQNYIKKVKAEIASSSGGSTFGAALLNQTTPKQNAIAINKVSSAGNYQSNQEALQSMQLTLLNMLCSQLSSSPDGLSETEDPGVGSISPVSSEIKMMISLLKEQFTQQLSVTKTDNFITDYM